MSTKAPKDRLYVRPTPEALHAMKTLLVALQSPALFGPDLTQEDFVTASWLWMSGMGREDLAAEIKPHVEAVRAARRLAKEAARSPGNEATPGHTKVIRARKDTKSAG